MHELSMAVLLGPCAVRPGEPVLVGFSGGADSLFLLLALHRSGIPVIAAHFNHHLRPASDHDEKFAADFAARHGVSFVSGSGDVAGFARSHGLTLEAAARQLRYQFLFAEATRQGAQAVAVAHHADDQVETVLLHILRGSGSAGMSGMPYRLLPNPWSPNIPLVRPLLGLWKEEILDFCAANKLAFCEDESNRDQTYRRNEVRHNIIPVLERFNPQVRHALYRLAQISRDEQTVLDSVVDQAWKIAIQSVSAHTVILDTSAYSDQPVAVQRLVIRKAVSFLRPGMLDVDFPAVERVRTAIVQRRAGAQVDLVGGLRLEMFGQQARLAAWEGIPEATWPQLLESRSVKPDIPVPLLGDWVFIMHPVEMTPAVYNSILNNTDPFQAWVDAGEVQGKLELCPRWAGARLQPLGMDGGTQKVSDLMVNHKIPRPARSAWPLLCSNQQVIWIPGMTIAHPYRITHATRLAYLLTLRSGPDLAVQIS